MKSVINLLLLVTVGWCGPNFGMAQTWMLTSASTNLNWANIACSADGTKLVALEADIWVSINSGATWATANSPNTSATFLTITADGSRLVASDGAGFIYTSTDLGNNWSSNAVPTGFRAIALSADGTRMAASVSGSSVPPPNDVVYTSADSGATWVPHSLPITLAFSIASSADGTTLVAAGGLKGSIFTSTNSGATWSAGALAGGVILNCAASSADGTKLVAGGEGPSESLCCLASTNSGATWTTNILSGGSIGTPSLCLRMERPWSQWQPLLMWT